MCLSVLAYQEIGRRIEELTGAIYALDPYFVMSSDEAATLSQLVASARHAQAARRARSPERRPAAPLAPHAPHAPSPAGPWALGGTTYAEIVKGAGSRSSSRGEPRAPSSPPDDDRDQVDPTPVLEPCVISERVDENPSDPRVCEIGTTTYDNSVSETYTRDVNVYYDDYVERSAPVESVQEQYMTPPVEYQELPDAEPEPIYEEQSATTVQSLPEQPMQELHVAEPERAPSPYKHRSHELSYAEILALGLRKQARTQSVTSLPTPQVAHVELVKEIVVECVESSPTIQQYESKVERIEPPRFKPDRQERSDRPERVDRLERPERPPPRSRSREMPRQRRAPEKRPTKAHDVQASKKKKTMKKVIEVQDFDEPEFQVELNPISDTSKPMHSNKKEEIVKEVKEVTKKLQHSATVVETVTEVVTEDSQPETAVEEVEHKKSKKKKPKKPKSSEDEILKALKEIEELEKNKKKKVKEPRDKSKDSAAEFVAIETQKEFNVETKMPQHKEDAQIKSKKKKTQKDVPDKYIDSNAEFITIESNVSQEETIKDTKPKKKKSQKQSSVEQLTKSHDPADCMLDALTLESSVSQKSVVSSTHLDENTTCSTGVNQENKQISLELINHPEDDHSKQQTMMFANTNTTITDSTIEFLNTNIVTESKTETTVVQALELGENVAQEDMIPTAGTMDEPQSGPDQITVELVSTTSLNENVVTELLETDGALGNVQVVEETDKRNEPAFVSIKDETTKQEADTSKDVKHKNDLKSKRKGPSENLTLVDASTEFIIAEQTSEEQTLKISQVDKQDEESSSKNKKKKKQKKQEYTPERTVCEEKVENYDENVKVIAPLEIKETVTEHVEEQKTAKKKKAKKGKSRTDTKHVAEDMKENIETEQIEAVQITDITENIRQELEIHTPQDEIKRSKKKSKPKVSEGTDLRAQIVEETHDHTGPPEVTGEDLVFVEVKTHKKKKTKKQKIDDNDIEKALKEIERTESAKRKPKDKAPKLKHKVEQPKSSIDDTNVSKIILDERQDKNIPICNVSHDNSPEDENIQPIEHIDWNAMLEEEEGVTETTFEPITLPTSESRITETAYVANQVTILQEATNLLVEKESTIIDNKINLPEEGNVYLEETSTSKNSKEEKVVNIAESKQLVASPANEQNNNDKFFSPDTIKEGSFNIVEEITHYEPMTRDVETRTIYLITHEEKKLPPIRTVKIRSKSNSLEEPAAIQEDVVLSKESTNNKITDEKSSITLSDNILDAKDITEEFFNEEKILTSITETVVHTPENVFIETDTAAVPNVIDQVSELIRSQDVTESAIGLVEQESVDKTGGFITNIEGKLLPDTEPNTTEQNKEDFATEQIMIIDNPKSEERVVKSTSKTLSEEDFSDILEEAIFGSVQDRNRVPAEKRIKDKFPNIPYHELVNEFKTYSVDLDTYQLDYEYTQLMFSQREKSCQQGDDIIADQIRSKNEHEMVESPLHHSEEQAPRVDYQVLKADEVVSTVKPTDSSKMSPVTEEVPKINYQELKSAELSLAESSITKSVNEKDSSTCVFDSEVKTTTETFEDLKVIEEKQPQVQARELVKNPPTEENLTLPTKATSLVWEKPRTSYHEIRDAELILASQTYITRVSECGTETKDKVEGVKNPEQLVTPVAATDSAVITPLSENIDRFSPLKEEAPKISYHELKDAEKLLATHASIDSNAHEICTEDSKSTKSMDIKIETDIAESAYTEISTMSKTTLTTDHIVSKQTLDTIVTESSITKSTEMERLPSISTEKCLFSPETTEENEPNHHFEALRNETPHNRYYEINDAEIQLGLATNSAVESQIDIIDDEGHKTESTLNVARDSPELKPAQIVSELARQSPYQEISDAEKLAAKKVEIGTVTITEQNINRESSDVEKSRKPMPWVYETPRISYHEISDAESLLATILSKSTDTNRESSLSQELIEETKDSSATKEDATEKHVATDMNVITVTSVTLIEQKVYTQHEAPVSNGELNSPVTENVPELVPEPEPLRQSVHEVPRFSYHELSDAENLFGLTRNHEFVEEFVEQDVVDSVTLVADMPTRFIEPSAEIDITNDQDVAKEQTEIEIVFEPLRHSYCDIQDAERILATIKSREATPESSLKDEQLDQNEAAALPDKVTSHSLSSEETLITVVSNQAGVPVKTDVQHTKEFISEEIKNLNSVQSTGTAPVSPGKSLLDKKIELSFEVDDLSNTPIAVVYGNIGDETPTLEGTSPESTKQRDTNVAEITIPTTKTEQVPIDEDAFEIIDHSEVADITDDVQKLPIVKEKPQNIATDDDVSTKSTADHLIVATDISSENVLEPGSITPQTREDHKVVQDLIEEALTEHDTLIVIKNEPKIETFEIDDINDSLVPMVFGDIKDIEQSIKDREFEMLSKVDESKPKESHEIIDEVISVDEAPSFIDDIEIVETTEDFVIPEPSEILDEQANIVTDLSSEPKPDTISAEFITSEILQSQSNSPHSNITYIQSEVNTQKSTDSVRENLDLTNVTDTKLTKSESVTRVDKSPIHSLHDLLPEIDSIPEFKPSYPNTVLYSKLSADAPEFTPSYMYQTINTMSESRTELVQDAPLPLNVEETEEISAVPQLSYSSILQTRKDKNEPEQQSPSVIANIAPEHEITPEEVHEEHVEIKSKKSKKKKKKDKDERKEIVVVKTPDQMLTSVSTQRESQQSSTSTLPEPINVWMKAADDGKSYADVVAEGLVHDQNDFIQLVTEKPKEKENVQSGHVTEIPQEVEKVAVQSISSVHLQENVVETVSETDNTIGSWAKIVATKRPSPERTPKSEEVERVHTPIKVHPPLILVDETDNDHHKPDVEVDAEGFITVDRSRRSRSRSRDTRSQSTVMEKRETREKSENRFEALTSSLKPEDVESAQSPSEDDKPVKKPGRKSRSSKSREKEVKSKVSETAASTSDEDKLPPKKDKKKRVSKSKDSDIQIVEEKIEPLKVKEIKEPKLEENVEVTAVPVAQADSKKKSKKKKKDKKSVDVTEVTETSSPVEITSSEHEAIPQSIIQSKKFDTSLSTPESVQTPIKDRVFSDAQYWKMDPSSLDLSEIISVEIQHAPTYSSSETKTIKIEIKDDNVTTEDKPVKSVQLPKEAESKQSASQLIAQEFLAISAQTQELEAKIEEDQSLESKMADLQREIEEMLLPENDSSLSDDSPKELTDTQTSIEFQYDELLDNMSPSLATPEPDVFDTKSLEEPVHEQLPAKHPELSEVSKHEEDLDDKHISMSMIDSLLDDTDPISISMTETHSLEHTDDILVTQEEDITPRDVQKQDTNTPASDIVKPVSKEAITKELNKEDLQEKLDPSENAPPNKSNVIAGIDNTVIQVTSFIKTEQMQEIPLKSVDTQKDKDTTIKKSVVSQVASFIEMEQLHAKALEESKVLCGRDKLEIKNETVITDTVPKHETDTDNVSNIPVSNIDTATNKLTNLKADTFWTDKHNVNDAEIRLIERNSVEKLTILSDIDQCHVDEGISVEENIINDNSFWPEKHVYHDAECQYFLLLASKTKTPTVEATEIKIKDENDKDRDHGGSSGHSSEGEEPKEPFGSPRDSSYISMDLPGGICSWRDKSSYLSAETPTVVDETLEPVSREDILTTLPLEPAPSSSKQEPEVPPQRTTKDELSNDIETLLEEIRDVQTRLSDLPDESLDAMEEGLREGITVLVKCEEAAELLESKVMEYRSEQEVQSLLKELVVMKARIVKLLTQARDGLHIIQDAKVEMARQAKEIEDQKEKIAKLDKWLEAINNGLKETTVQSEILVEEDIIRYIEIYERYIREYEEYEIILKSITVISEDESSQSLKVKLNAMQKALEETKHLVIIEIERLRQVLVHLRSAPEVAEEDISQTDRTIDSTSMPEEVVSPREVVKETLLAVKEQPSEKEPSVKVPSVEESVEKAPTVQEASKPSHEKPEPVQIIKETVAIETQTGKSLMSEPPSVSDKSVICQPDIITTHDKSITCAPPQEVEVQTSEPHSAEKEILGSIQVRQTISDGHETIEIATRPIQREQRVDEHSLLVDADYRDDKFTKDSELNIIHSLPQSFETVMFEPDETTTEVVVDSDGTKRIIVKKVRKTLVTRQQLMQSQQHESHILSGNIPHDQAYSQIALTQSEGATSAALEDGGVQHIQYQTSQSQITSSLPGGEVTVQEFVSKPETVITMDKDMKPEDILQLVESGVPTQIQTSSSSVTAVVQQITRRVVKTRRRIIRRVVIIDGKEHVTEEIVEEPDDVEVLEEQIPRVSISVKERGDVPVEQGDDDNSGKDDPSFPSHKPGHPALPPRKDDISRDDKPGDKPDDKPGKDPGFVAGDKPGDNPLGTQDPNQREDAGDIDKAEQLDNLMQEFINKERGSIHTQTSKTTVVHTSHSRETTPAKTITVSETYEITPGEIQSQEPEGITYIVQEPQEGQIVFTTEGLPQAGQTMITSEGAFHSTFETSSTNVSTVVQRVVRKITKTRKRIIKHITIIDGKEHVTEEVIEEPDDVEVIEEEPQVSHSIQTEGMKTKRVRIVKNVEMIDGKEHVTEQIVEEPIGEEIMEGESKLSQSIQPESMSTKRVKLIRKVEVIDGKEHVTEQVVEEPDDDDAIEEVTKQSHSIQTSSEGVTTKRIQIIRKVEVIDGKEHVTEQVIEDPEEGVIEEEPYLSHSIQAAGTNVKRIKIIRKVEMIDGKEHVIEQVIEDPDDEEVLKDQPHLTPIVQTEDMKTTCLTTTAKYPTDDKDHTTELVISDSHAKDVPLSSDTIETGGVIMSKRIRIIKHIQIKDGKEHVTEEVIEEPVEVNVSEQPLVSQYFTNEGVQTKRVKIIRNVQIIDGKEHVTEHRVEEPDDDKIVEESTLSHNIQTQGVKTKRIKIIKRVEIIDGKEHITEEAVEEPDDEFVPNSTITAQIDLKLRKPDTVNTQRLDVESDKPVITSTKTTTTSVTVDSSQRDNSIIDITKSLISSETGHSTNSLTPITLKKEPAKEAVPPSTPTKEKAVLPEPQQLDDMPIHTMKETVVSTVPGVPETTTTKDGDIETHKVIKDSENIVTEFTTVTSPDKQSVIDVTNKFINREADQIQPVEVKMPEKIDNKSLVMETIETTKSSIPEISIIQKDTTTSPISDESKTIITVSTTKTTIPEEEQKQLEPFKATVENVPKESDIILQNIQEFVQTTEPEITVSNKIGKTKLTEHIIKTDLTEPSQTNGQSKASPTDVHKSFIESEMGHTVVSKIPASPVKKQPHVDVPKQPEQEKSQLQKADEIDDKKPSPIISDKKPSSETTQEIKQVIKTGDKTVTVEVTPGSESPTTALQEILLTEPGLPEAVKATEVTTVSVAEPKDTSLEALCDIQMTQSLIDSEMDHTVISKIPVTVSKKELIEVVEGKEVPKSRDQFDSIPKTTVTESRDITKTSTTDIKMREMENIKDEFVPHQEEKGTDYSKTESPKQDILPTQEQPVQLPRIPDYIPIEFVTQELPGQKVAKDIINLTTELLEQESTHAFTSPKETSTKNVAFNIPGDTTTTTIVKETLSREMPEDQEQRTGKPTVIDVIFKEGPVPDRPYIQAIEDEPKPILTDVSKETKLSEPIISEPVEDTTTKPIQRQPDGVQPTSEFPFLHAEGIEQEPQFSVVNLTKEFIMQEGNSKYEQIPEQVVESVLTETEKIISHATSQQAPTQSTVEVEPLKVGSVITEADVTELPKAPEMSYIRQFEPQVQGSSDSVDKLLAVFNQPEKQDVPSQTTEMPGAAASELPKPVPKYDVTMLLQSERQDTDLRSPKPETVKTQPEKHQQTVDISMSLTKNREAKKVEPKVKFDLKVEEFEAEPIVVKKEIEVILPSEIKVTKEKPKPPVVEAVKEQPKELTPPEPVKEPKKSKKKKKHKAGSTASESTEVDTDKSVADTNSSSLSHYVELPASPPAESPKPTKEILETPAPDEIPAAIPEIEPIPAVSPEEVITEIETVVELKSPEEPAVESREEIIDSYVESEDISISEERGYEAEDLSLGPISTPDKKKKHKKRRQHGISEETTYPKITTTETEDTTVTTPVEMLEPVKKNKDRKRKKKPAEPRVEPEEPEIKEAVAEPEPVVVPEPEVKQESPKLGTETVVSPKEESYHTMSETSDISTVKIIEECVQSSPEIAEKEVPTTVTFPVQVVEEIATQEYSIQTSPEETEPIEEISRPETSDIELQTTPTSMSEVITQTTPVEDKEAHTQTIEEITTVVEKIMSDTEMQTSRSETPEKIVQLEATTQVIAHDIANPEEKFSQTSPVEEIQVVAEEKPVSPEVETETREMQTSPEPEIQKDEKSTEILIETVETDIQTIKQEIAEQGTSTTPVKQVELTEMSMQTPEIPLVSTFTQSDTPEPTEEVAVVLEEKMPSLPPLEIDKQEVTTVDSMQQTTPREKELPKPYIKEIVTVDSSQQTTPREPEVIQALSPPAEKAKTPSPEPTIESPKKQVVTIDNTQQTTPRPETVVETAPVPVPIPVLDLEKRDVITIDSTQQTTPRGYSDDSISTSTSEPYEIHLKAQVTIPQATTDFLESERQFEEPPMSILGDKYKQKKRKSKKKTESPLLSPESLSDPINTELSMSVTPTSEDVSLRDASSIDEGISQLASPMMPSKPIAQPKLTYSDVVQRSKSKSPSPSKTLIPQKSEKARLLDALEKRTQSVTETQKTIPDDSMTVALLEPSVENSYQLVVDKELNEVKNAIESNDPSRTERSVIVVIETISIWLEEIQYKIQRQTLTGLKSSEETERLKKLQKDVLKLKHIIEVTEVNEEIITLIETLTRQVDAVNTLSSQSSVKVKEYEREWIKFLDDTDKLSDAVERVKNTLDNLTLSEIPTQQKLEKLDKLESSNFDNIEAVRKMFKRCRSLIEANPKRECPTKLYDCDDDTKQVENTINTERDRLLQLASLAEEYEQTLQDFGQITDVAEALLDGKIIVSDLDHLHEEIQKHRKFFVNLSHCRAILESLEDNLDPETRAKYSSLHTSLHDRATVIIDRAASRAQQMTLAASRWTLLQHSMKEEQQWLVVAQQRVPDLSNVTSIDHEQYINLYQSISLDLSHHYAKILRLLSITESLQNLIVCSGLETECSIALDTLLKLQEDVDSRLTRLTAFKENWVTYDHLIDRIEGWMKIANRELEFITPDNITSTGNLRRFWELKAQHEVYNNLKNESGVQFEKALEILPVSDEMVQRQFFSKIEDKWSDLATKIGSIHSSAIQNISDRDVSSGEKLNILEEELRELRASVDGLKGVIKSEDELNLYIERLQVMTSRIDRIHNELGRLSLLPTAESERLGALLSQSGVLDDQIAEELERSMLLKEKIVQVQAGIARCQKSQRRARLTLEECEAAERLGSDVVERASQTCDKLIEELGAQWRDILALRQALHTLPTSLRVVVSPTGVEKDISALQETHSELEAACSDLSSRLRSKLQLWRRFERQLELVQGAVREADYLVELLTVQGQVDYDRLLKATEKLETLSESLSRRSGELVGELCAAAAPLEASTEPAVAAALRRELDHAAAAYDHTCANLTQLCDKYNNAVELWKRYRDAAAAVRAFADYQEATLHALRPADAPATAQVCTHYCY